MSGKTVKITTLAAIFFIAVCCTGFLFSCLPGVLYDNPNDSDSDVKITVNTPPDEQTLVTFPLELSWGVEFNGTGNSIDVITSFFDTFFETEPTFTRYPCQLQVSSSSSFTATLVDEIVTVLDEDPYDDGNFTYSYILLTDTVVNGDLYWRVRVRYDADNLGSWSEVWKFSTNAVFGGGGQQVTASADAYITNYSSYESINYGTDPVLRVGNLPYDTNNQYYFLVNYDISSLPAVAAEAKIVLYAVGSSTAGYPTSLRAYRITETWSENTATFNSKPAYSGTYSGSCNISFWPTSTDGSYCEIIVTDLYNSWKNNDYGNYGVAIVPYTSSADSYQKDFVSKDSTAYPSYKPVLMVTE